MQAPLVTGAQIVFRLPPELRQQLEETAERNERTLSQELRRAIRFYVALQQQERER